MENKAIQQLKALWEEDVAYSRTVTFYAYQTWARLDAFLKPFRAQAKNLSLVAFVVVAVSYVMFPRLANADMEFEQIVFNTRTVEMIIDAMQNQTEEYGSLPISKDAPARRYYTIPVTAYSSEVWQTDDSPCVTASGLEVCERGIENIVAANFLPIGTRVRIPELYGDKVFYVEDRMNTRYHYKMDIWMKDLVDAEKFGVQDVTIEVF